MLNGGEDTDPNAISFATGYNKVVFDQQAKTVAAGAKGTAGGATLVAENFAPGWDNTKGGTIFQQAYTANPKINATIEANDGLANAVITDLKTQDQWRWGLALVRCLTSSRIAGASDFLSAAPRGTLSIPRAIWARGSRTRCCRSQEKAARTGAMQRYRFLVRCWVPESRGC